MSSHTVPTLGLTPVGGHLDRGTAGPAGRMFPRRETASVTPE
jgi:hypothetical protein